MKLAIDGSNLRAGGGLRHLVEFLTHAEPSCFGFDEIFLWVGPSTFQELAHLDFDWLTVFSVPAFDRDLLSRYLWRKFKLKKLVEKNCDVLFSPGGLILSPDVPEVTMSRNMQPFDKVQKQLAGFSLERIRLELLTVLQSRSFRKADEVIFLTPYAKDFLSKLLGLSGGVVIPHGCNLAFRNTPKEQHKFTGEINLLYVSTYNTYKHQLEVIDALVELRKIYPGIKMTFVGGGRGRYKDLVRAKIDTIINEGLIVEAGKLNQSELSDYYKKADVIVYASSCENLPNILLESMSSGVPIACSNREPMPSVLNNHGVYFEPTDSDDIKLAVSRLIEDTELRSNKAHGAFQEVGKYTWEKCAYDTLALLSKIAKKEF